MTGRRRNALTLNVDVDLCSSGNVLRSWWLLQGETGLSTVTSALAARLSSVSSPWWSRPAPPRPLRPTLRLDFIVMQMRPWPLHTIWMRLLMAFTATCKDVYSCGARAQPRRSSQRVRATRAYLVSGWQETHISYGYEWEIRPSCRACRTYGFVAPDSWSLRVPASRDRTTVGHGVPHACERCSGGAGRGL